MEAVGSPRLRHRYRPGDLVARAQEAVASEEDLLEVPAEEEVLEVVVDLEVDLEVVPEEAVAATTQLRRAPIRSHLTPTREVAAVAAVVAVPVAVAAVAATTTHHLALRIRPCLADRSL